MTGIVAGTATDAGENGAGQNGAGSNPNDACCAGSGSASDAPVSEEMLKNAFAEKLAGLEFIEKLQGITMSGPHKDDLALCASGYEMRSVGSQGQCRSAASKEVIFVWEEMPVFTV